MNIERIKFITEMLKQETKMLKSMNEFFKWFMIAWFMIAFGVIVLLITVLIIRN
jgi:hypothetical protein